MRRPGLPISLLAFAAAAACAPRAMPEPGLAAASAAPVVAVPAGCEADLSGQYVHAQVERYQYRATDDGGTLTLALERDAGPAVEVVLHRSAEGFVGATRAAAGPDAGAACAVELPTLVVACTAAGLVLKSEASAAFDGACRPLPLRPAPVEHRRVRLADAGAK